MSRCMAVALHALYHATGGPRWRNTSGWPPLRPCEEPAWGVVCVGGTIVGMWLTDNNLEGTIPSAVGGLSAMSSMLLLGGNARLSGTIPTESVGSASNGHCGNPHLVPIFATRGLTLQGRRHRLVGRSRISTVVLGHRRIVGSRNQDRHRSSRISAIAIGNDVRERIGTHLILLERVKDVVGIVREGTTSRERHNRPVRSRCKSG